MPTAPHPKDGALSRGWRRLRVIRLLAEGVYSQSQIAAMLGVGDQAISNFARNHRSEIEALMISMDDELQTLWIADKTYRLAELQQAVEDINGAIDNLAESGAIAAQDMSLFGEKRKILRAAAEELGQITGKSAVEVTGASITYEFPGVDPTDLR